MPIYAYRCASCGHAKDVLQKVSDAPLTVCPSCGAESFQKQLTAAGFQLKGSGWYVTDFRGGSGSAGSKPATGGDGGSSGGSGSAGGAASGDGGSAAGSGSSGSSSSSGDGGSTAAGGCGSSCACH